jgi:hypothetical protein
MEALIYLSVRNLARRISFGLAVLSNNQEQLERSEIPRATIHLLSINLQNPFHWRSPVRMQKALWMTY